MWDGVRCRFIDFTSMILTQSNTAVWLAYIVTQIYDFPYHMPCYVTVIIFFTVWLRKTITSVTFVEMRHRTWHWFSRERYWKYEMKQCGLDYTDLNWRPQEVIKLLICLSQQNKDNRRWQNNIWDWRYEKKLNHSSWQPQIGWQWKKMLCFNWSCICPSAKILMGSLTWCGG